MTGLRYLKLRSNAANVMSSISCGVEGAKTSACVLPWPSPRHASLMSACSGPMFPSPGPPRMMLTNTPGTSAPIMYEMPSSIRLKPGDDVKVIDRSPALPGAVHVVDGRHFADRLERHTLQLRQQRRHQLGAFRRGRDRVAEEVAAAGQQGADGRGVVALHNERLADGQPAVLIRHVGRRGRTARRRSNSCLGSSSRAIGSRSRHRPYGSGQASKHNPQALHVSRSISTGTRPVFGLMRSPKAIECLLAGGDAAPAALAELRRQRRLRSTDFRRSPHSDSSSSNGGALAIS